eukprot:m.1663487 g.1663487  ORF g.1663487 m.1663487 type:complete len:61 (+) comp136877_c0_seq1:61-243(+)
MCDLYIFFWFSMQMIRPVQHPFPRYELQYFVVCPHVAMPGLAVSTVALIGSLALNVFCLH